MTADPQWLAVAEEVFTQWVLKALRRQGYLAAHVNAIGTCTACGARSVAKMEPGVPDIIAVSPFPDARAPIIMAELKTERGSLTDKRKMIGRNRNRRLLPSQLDWAKAARIARRQLLLRPRERSPLSLPLGATWRPHHAAQIQEMIGDDGRERQPWDAIDACEFVLDDLLNDVANW